MPVLPVPKRTGVELPISGGRRATADDFGGADFGGKAISTAANAYLASAEESEARKALVASSEIRAQYARRLDEAAITGEDLGKLKESLQNDLAKVGEGFQTKRGVDSLALYTSNTELMYDEQANKIAVQRAAAVARLEGGKFLQSAGAILQSNPLYLGMAEKDAEAFGDTLKGIRPEQRAEIVQGLKGELNMAAAVASARIDPEGTKARLEKGEWNLTPDQRNMAVNRADSELRAKRADESYRQAQADREERDRNDKARDKHFGGIMNGTATRRTIMDDADLQPATREHLIVFMEARAKAKIGEEKQSDPTAKRDLWLAIHAPDGDPKKIYNADPIFEMVKAGKLNTTDANQLNALVAGQRDEQGRAFGQRLQGRVQTVASAMRSSPQYQAQPELASAIQNELISQVEKKAAALRAKNEDPSVLLDPDHKDYYFKPNLIKSVADDVQRRAQALLPQLPRVTSETDPLLAEVGVGQQFIDPQGVTRVMTKALKDKLGTPGAKGPVVSGKITGAQ